MPGAGRVYRQAPDPGWVLVVTLERAATATPRAQHFGGHQQRLGERFVARVEAETYR